MKRKKLKVGIWGFTGCAGDQLTILHTEDKLVEFFNSADILVWEMAQSANNEDALLDVAFVEGSITTEEQIAKLRKIRERTQTLVALGTCACLGGVQSSKGDIDYTELFQKVYETPVSIDKYVGPKPIDTYVKVDYYLTGCPIDAHQFLQLYARLLYGIPWVRYPFPVCTECKWRENDCLLLRGIPCLGPLTISGCGAICPTYGRPCIGCFGPVDDANVASEVTLLRDKFNLSPDKLLNRLRIYGGKKADTLIERLTKLEGEP